MAASANHACNISDKGSLTIDGKKVVNLNKITLENLHTLLLEWGVGKQDLAWKPVITKIRSWYSKQFKDYIPPPQPVKKMMVRACVLGLAARASGDSKLE